MNHVKARKQLSAAYKDISATDPKKVSGGESKGPLTLTRSGKAATLTFQGQAKDGVNVQVTAKCGSVDEF
jgi:hypothetical protein